MKGTLGYKIRTITCAHCGQTHTGHLRPDQRFCSQTCSQAAPKPGRKTGRNVTCEHCGATFYMPKNRLERVKHYFCCLEHQIAWQGRNKDSYACKVCGKVFLWSPSRKSYNVTYCSLGCRDADPDRHAMLIEMNAAQQRGQRTRIEQIGYSILNAIGVVYQAQYVIGGKFCVDAFLPEHDLVIQFDGDYWHGNPDRFPNPDTRQRKRICLDASQDAYMQACGYRVLRIWEHELLISPDSAHQSILNALKQC